MTDRYTVVIDLSKDDDDLCDGLPADVITRLANLDWRAQFMRRVGKIEALSEELQAVLEWESERDKLLKRAQDFLDEMRERGLDKPLN